MDSCTSSRVTHHVEDMRAEHTLDEGSSMDEEYTYQIHIYKSKQNYHLKSQIASKHETQCH